MTLVLAEPAERSGARRERAAALGDQGRLPLCEPVAGEARRTLDDLVSGAWEALSTGAPTSCPVCHGALAPRWSAGAGVVGGRCRDCGTELG